MAKSGVLMPGNGNIGSRQLIPTAATAIGAYFGYPALGKVVGQGYGAAADNQAAKGQAVSSGQGVAPPAAQTGIGGFAGGAINEFVGAGKEIAGKDGGGSNTNLMDQKKTGSPYELPAMGYRAEEGPMQDANQYGGAMERRMETMNYGDAYKQLEAADDALYEQDPEIQAEYRPIIQEAKYRAKLSSRPAGSMAPTTHYIQTKRYGAP